MSFLKKKYFNNIYFYLGMLFLIWIAFFDENSLVEQRKLKTKLEDLDAREVFYKKEIEKTKSIIKGFTTDTARLEKFAREKYHMKKDNEEVFIIVRED
jgi:cell division protein FtsB